MTPPEKTIASMVKPFGLEAGNPYVRAPERPRSKTALALWLSLGLLTCGFVVLSFYKCSNHAALLPASRHMQDAIDLKKKSDWAFDVFWTGGPSECSPCFVIPPARSGTSAPSECFTFNKETVEISVDTLGEDEVICLYTGNACQFPLGFETISATTDCKELAASRLSARVLTFNAQGSCNI